MAVNWQNHFFVVEDMQIIFKYKNPNRLKYLVGSLLIIITKIF